MKFYISIDEQGGHDVDSDKESTVESVASNSTQILAIDTYEVTITVPKAKAKRVHLGAVKVLEDGANITVENVEAV